MRYEIHRLGKDHAMSIRPARTEDASRIARVHVDSWCSTYSGIISENFLAAMSYEDFGVRWRNWLGGEFGARGTLRAYMAELPANGTVGFASSVLGRRRATTPSTKANFTPRTCYENISVRG
jgi:hypothetical protein